MGIIAMGQRTNRSQTTVGHEDKQESDQLPEEAPSEQVSDDAEDGAARRARTERDARDEGDSPDAERQATGHPPNAG
jgi:hypothetical protein